MSQVIGKAVKPQKANPNPVAALKRVLAKELEAANGLHMAISKIKGIMEGAATDTELPKLLHRLRSIVGHRKALASAVNGMAASMLTLITLESSVG